MGISHEKDARPYVKAAYAAPFAKLINLSEAKLADPGRQEMAVCEQIVNNLAVFGVLNYPLPQ